MIRYTLQRSKKTHWLLSLLAVSSSKQAALCRRAWPYESVAAHLLSLGLKGGEGLPFPLVKDFGLCYHFDIKKL